MCYQYFSQYNLCSSWHQRYIQLSSFRVAEKFQHSINYIMTIQANLDRYTKHKQKTFRSVNLALCALLALLVDQESE